MRKKVVTVLSVLAALAAFGIVTARADRQYTPCDVARSPLCSGLVAVYEFEEDADQARTSETGSGSLLEYPAIDVARADNGALTTGTYALSHVASAKDGLYIFRTAPFVGSFSMGFWLNVSTLPTSGKVVPILWMCDVASSTESAPKDNCLPARYPMLYLYNNAGTSQVWYGVTHLDSSLAETSSYVNSTQAINTGTWYYVAFGQYANPTYTALDQQTLWISVSTTTVGSRATANIPHSDYGLTGHFMVAGMGTTSGTYEYGAFKVDQLAAWTRYLLGSDLTTLVNGGNGKPYPFY
jgi:hypothetical protein